MILFILRSVSVLFLISFSNCCTTDFKDKVVIVTGSSSGIGAVTAKYFADRSAKLVLTARNEEKLKKVAEAVEEANGVRPLVVKADLTVDKEVASIINETIKEFGRIDVLVNNAGAGFLGKIQDGINLFDKIISLNLRSVYLLTSLAAPYLIKSKGNIINVSAVVSLKPTPLGLPYSISKAGLDAFTKGVAAEMAPHGVRVNSVNPAAVPTNILRAQGLSEQQSANILEKLIKNSPLGYISTPENVADLIGFLANDKARTITGSVYVIDNGYLLESPYY